MEIESLRSINEFDMENGNVEMDCLTGKGDRGGGIGLEEIKPEKQEELQTENKIKLQLAQEVKFMMIYVNKMYA
jgi:hypothetical protein